MDISNITPRSNVLCILCSWNNKRFYLFSLSLSVAAKTSTQKAASASLSIGENRLCLLCDVLAFLLYHRYSYFSQLQCWMLFRVNPTSGAAKRNYYFLLCFCYFFSHIYGVTFLITFFNLLFISFLIPLPPKSLYPGHFCYISNSFIIQSGWYSLTNGL